MAGIGSIPAGGWELRALEALRDARPASEVRPLEVVPGLGGASPVQPGDDFASKLGEAIKAVDAQQVRADQESTRLAMGGGNLHETALALEKADLSMRVATKVRNRMVEAYQEIMRMSV